MNNNQNLNGTLTNEVPNQEFNNLNNVTPVNNPSNPSENANNGMSLTPNNVEVLNAMPTNNVGNPPVNNSPTNQTPKKNKFLIPLVVVGCLIVLLVGLGVYKFIYKKPTPKNVYYEIIDTVSEKFLSAVKTPSLLGNEADITFNMKSSDKDIQKIATIINKMSLKYDLGLDYENKKISLDLQALYNNKKLLSPKIYADNKNIYVNLDNLYNRPISLLENSEDYANVWDTKSADLKIIVEEMSKIIKNSLKTEYFTTTEEKITVLNKSINTTKYRLNLTAENQVAIIKQIIDDMLNNSKLLQSCSEVSAMSVTEIKEKLQSFQNDITNDGKNITIDVYTSNGNKLEKIELDNEESKIVLEKIAENKFNIVVAGEKYGTLTLDEKETALDIDYEGVKLSLKMSDTLVEVSMSAEGTTLELNYNKENANDISIKAKIKMPTPDLEFTININATNKEIKSVEGFNTANAIKADNLTEEDTNKILNNIANNETLLELINEISNIFESSEY